jgi:hypothetical protein
MNIQPTYATFEQAKLLKEKGFDLKSKYHYPDLSEKQEICLTTDWNNFTDMAGNSEYFTAPKQWQVVEWLRVNHGLWIVVNLGIVHEKGTMFFANIIKFGKHHKSKHRTLFYTSPQEAYSTAFDYIRENNLI